jgi:hypothetical protein
MQHCRLLRRTSIATVALLGACASGPNDASAPVQADELNTWVERVHVEAERSRDAVADAFERLNTLAAGRFDKDPAAVMYARFVQSIDVAEQQAKRFRECVGPMQKAAEPVFRNWEKDLATYTNDRMRQRSELRYAVAKERYDAIHAVAVPAQDQFDGFVRSLRDHATFLAHDLNSGSIDDIQEEVKIVAQTALELDHNMESTMSAARTYVERSSLPAAPPPSN